MENTESKISFDLPKYRSNVIKVIGVGGGGSNAINYMFEQGINGVDFVISNTDLQALEKSSVPIKIQLGASLTEGLGAGANPEVGKMAAQESFDELKTLLSTQTKMVFITAGMGGGTGTGAAPIIAKMAKELDVLTVGIVTMPFQFEGKLRLDQAQKGLEELKNNVDSLIVINNNKLREVYGNLGFKAGFAKADEVLANAARGIAEVITHHYTQNIDLKDAKTVLKDSGSAIMGSSSASGSNRAQEAIINALDSPLLNDNKISGCKNVLLLIVSGAEEITIDEIGEINEFIQAEAGNGANIIMGVGEDLSLGDEIAVTIIATGFNIDQQQEIVNSEVKKIIHTLEDEQTLVQDLSEKKTNIEINHMEDYKNSNSLFSIIDDKSLKSEIEESTEEITNIEINHMEDCKNSNPLFSITDDKSLKGEIEESAEESKNIEINHIENYQNSNPLFSITDDESLKSETESIEEINNLEICFEVEDYIKENKNDQELDSFDNDYIINEIPESIKEIELVDFIDFSTNEENQFSFKFDLSLDKINENEKIEKNIIDNEIRGDDQDSFENSINLHSYDVDFEKKEDFNKKNIETELKLKTVKVDSSTIIKTSKNDFNPYNNKIDKSLSKENETRRDQLKKFNYSFNSNISKIEEMEKQPAYKRMGFDLEDESGNKATSQTSIDNDSNDETQLRSNNSFLHDNVD
tara:strand:- start:1617 stop:3701 length:2085 start_codon:yes stop_codon:yes gene_type:complete